MLFLYACIYYVMGENFFDFGGLGRTPATCLYFSISTATTLGIGDISALTDEGTLIMCSECVLGLIIAGLFLDSVAFRKSEAVDEDKQLDELIGKYDYECKKMLQFCKVIDVTLDHYAEAAIQLLDGSVADISDINENMPEECMTHVFDSVFDDRHRDISYTRVYHFMNINEEVISEIRQLIREINMEYWPDFESLCLKFISSQSDLRVEEFFRRSDDSEKIWNEWENAFERVMLSEQMAGADSGDDDDEKHKAFTPFTDLRSMLVTAADFIRNFRKSLDEIQCMDPENAV